MSNIEIMQEALDTMPQFFTSREFGLKTRQLGGSLDIGKTGALTNFLNSECKNLTGQRWEKKNSKPMFKMPENSMSEQECIDFLKNRGYKIYKTIEL